MVTGWRYRAASVSGAFWITVLAAALSDLRALQELAVLLPLLGRLPVTPPGSPSQQAFEMTTAVLVVLVALVPLYKPRPRRILDTISMTHKRVVGAALLLATIGYFDYTYRLPRLTLILLTALLLVSLPPWFALIRRQPRAHGERAIIIGDDPELIEAVLDAADLPIVGYVSPPSRFAAERRTTAEVAEYANGGRLVDGSALSGQTFLGGLSRLDDVLVRYDIDTAILAFSHPDREEFFGTLDTCYDHGVTAVVHREHADGVLVKGLHEGDLVQIDLEPWDPQDYVLKRAFDVAFSIACLVALSPVVVAIAVAIRLDSPGPILYSQQRTAEFGETFTVYKFRTMVPDAEADTGATLSAEDAGDPDPRVTHVGRVLRPTHLDEIPQLWSILVGDMSVVGPRPERPELDSNIERGGIQWRRRWFVRPGLTGLAQIKGVTGYQPEEKLRYDVEYIRRQSFWFDLKIVIRQTWEVAGDVVGLLRRPDADG